MAGVKGEFKAGDFNLDDALGATQTNSTKQVEEPAPIEQPKESVKTETQLEPKSQEGYKEIIDKPVEEQPKTTKAELKDEDVLDYFKSKGREFKSLEDVFKQPEPTIKEVEKEIVKEVNPYDEFLDDNDRAYLDYKKETGRSYNDFLNLSKNWDEVPEVELARDKARKDTGLNLSDKEADDVIADELGIDLQELEGVDKIKFQAYASKHRKALKEEQKQYKAPIKKEPKKVEPTSAEEKVTLEDGRVLLKSDYDKLVNEHKQYIENTKKAVDSITDLSFNVSVSDNGEKRDLSYSYDLTEDDKHSMLSLADVGINKFIEQEFTDKEGNFKYQDFQRSMYLAKESNLNKVIQAVVEKARAEAIEEYLQERNNVNFQPRSLQKTEGKNDGYGTLLGQQRNGYGVLGNL